MAQLTEQYRPTCWEQVIGQDKIVAKIRALAKRGLAGRAYWLSGQSGTGKTTIARLIASEIAGEFGIEEVDAQGLTPARLQELERGLSFRGWGDKPGKVIIINEAHALSKACIRQLLTTLERIPGHAAWVFTTTTEGQEGLFEDYDDASPLLSRCLPLTLARRGLAEAFAARAKEIAEQEGLDGRPVAQYVRLLQDCRNNMRQALQRIEAGEMVAE